MHCDSLPSFAALAAALLLSSLAPSQCVPTWSSPGGATGPNGPVHAMLRLANGDVIAGGDFFTVGATTVNRIARWNGSSWSPLGTGMNDTVYSLTIEPNGDVVAGGSFTQAGGVAVAGVARWNGTAWSPVGFIPIWTVYALGHMPNGDLVAGLYTGVQRWDGASWQQLGAMSGGVAGFAVRNGELIAAGSTYVSLYHYAAAFGRWSGGAWTVSTVGAVDTSFAAVTALPNGDLVFGGQFAAVGAVPARNVARWNGSTFAPLGAGVGGAADFVASVAVQVDDSVVAGGFFPGGGLARWDGSTWTPLDTGVDGGVRALARAPDGVFAAGDFAHAGGLVAPNIARWSTPCVASVASYGSGCAGSGGLAALTTTNGPWVGGTFRATGTGMPAVAIVASLYGFGPTATPLAALLPGALPGCSLLVTPDLSNVLLPFGGVAQSQLAIPNLPAAGGFLFHHQLVALEMTGVLQFGAITSTNALAVTVGTF